MCADVDVIAFGTAKRERQHGMKRLATAPKSANVCSKAAETRGRRGNHAQQTREHRCDMGFVAPSPAASGRELQRLSERS